MDLNKLIIYNNNRLKNNFGKTLNANDIIIYNFSTNSYEYYQKDIFEKYDKNCNDGSCRYIKRWSLFIMEHNSGRLLMFDKNKNLLWEYINSLKSIIIIQNKWIKIDKYQSKKFEENSKKIIFVKLNS